MDKETRQELGNRQKAASAEAVEADRLFNFLHSHDVNFVVVCDVREYETEIGSDIDIVVSNSDLERLPDILLKYCEQNTCRLVQILRHEASALYFALTFQSGNQVKFVHPDVCSDYIRSTRELQLANELLDARVRNSMGLWIPRPLSGFKYYLMKKIDKGNIDARQLEYLADLRSQDPSAIDSWVQKPLGPELGRQVIRTLDEQDLQAFKAVMPALRREFIEKKPIRISDRFKEIGRLADRITRPTGVMLGFLGPDGVGKSSVIAEVERQIAPAFRKQARFHLRPHFGKPQGTSVTVEDPHSGRPRGISGSMAKLALWWLDYVSGYFRGVYPKLIRSTLVVFDRYADDLAVDPRRYRYGGPLWMARVLSRMVPRPDLMFVLVADPEIIQARKAEVPLAETSRQVEEYRKLAQRKGVILIDAGRPLKEVVSDIVEETLKWMERRTHKRLGLKP